MPALADRFQQANDAGYARIPYTPKFHAVLERETKPTDPFPGLTTP